ncbi:hypothetical protein PI124_g20125 [Phytophthora idaei]|nr:hypothetical protein PI125_g21273 [Phytophthora idaei]KAG3234827.1 hypothetical protein PI124_g20125 [Phytophthora idaei]
MPPSLEKPEYKCPPEILTRPEEASGSIHLTYIPKPEVHLAEPTVVEDKYGCEASRAVMCDVGVAAADLDLYQESE